MILGTPVDEETLERLRALKRQREEPKPPPEPIPPPLVPPRPADELPRAASGVRDLAVEYGWEVDATYWMTGKEVDNVMLRGRRRDLGWLAVWEGGKFDFALTLAGRRAERVGSKQLKEWVQQRDEECRVCHRSPPNEECEA